MRTIGVLMLALPTLTAYQPPAAGAVPQSPRPIDPQRLEFLWADLASTDPIQALAALLAMADKPEPAVQWLETHLRPVRGDQPQINRWIADLDSPHFTARARASEELERVVDIAAPQLRKALQEKP